MGFHEDPHTYSEHEALFYVGHDQRAYEIMGAHPATQEDQKGYLFRVFAPAAARVSLIGEFNGWDRNASAMVRNEQGIWSLFWPGVRQFDAYKFSILRADGKWIDKSDPYAFHAETRPANASKVFELEGYDWQDESWLSYRAQHLPYNQPVNIYEIHFGSWKRHEDQSFYSYREMADVLIPYVKSMGYTHIEIMPLMEHPFDGSWGYQVTGYFAATSRYGTPHDLMNFVDRCHRAGVGVIMDWVPAHFPKDENGLIEFDGSCLYEYEDPLKKEHAEWGTRVFDYGKTSVRNLLFSSATFWIEIFHFDGLRVDAVAAMLYLDYNRNAQWRPNVNGGKENLEAVDFIRLLNEKILTVHPHVMMIAEESTAWPLVTKPGYDGGLGFNFKWNMGWMHDTLSYMSADPFFRKDMHEKITFSFMYAFSENYVLALSHDEVVHGKRSLLGRMPEPYDNQFASLRMLYGYMMAYPGKKLLFMGGEFGQFTEWAFQNELDWMLLAYDSHRKLQKYVRELNLFYLRSRPLWDNDMQWEGFEWISHEDHVNNVIAFRRMARDGSDLLAVFNFAPVGQEEYCIGAPYPGSFTEVFSSDASVFGGGGGTNGKIKTENLPMHGRNHTLRLRIPPLSMLYLQGERRSNSV